MEPLFLRRRDTADACAVSESVVLQWERRGLLKAIKLPGLRAVRHSREQVEDLARKITQGEIPDEKTNAPLGESDRRGVKDDGLDDGRKQTYHNR